MLLTALSAVLYAFIYVSHIFNTDSRMLDREVFAQPTGLKNSAVGCECKHTNWLCKARVTLYKNTDLSGVQYERIQMPVCMKLGSSMCIEALLNMIELRNT